MAKSLFLPSSSTGVRERQTVRQAELLLISAFSIGQVTITILDENDNSPQFDITSDSSVSVAEDSSVGRRIALVLARDPDAGSNGQVAMIVWLQNVQLLQS